MMAASPAVWTETDPRDQWTVPESNDHTPPPQTVYVPSFWGSQTEFTQYCGSRGIVLSTKERVRSTWAIDAVFQPCHEPVETVDVVPGTLPKGLQQKVPDTSSNPCSPGPSKGTQPVHTWRRIIRALLWIVVVTWRIIRWIPRSVQRCLDQRYTYHRYTKGLRLEFGRTYTKTLQAYTWNRARQRPAQREDIAVAETNITTVGPSVPLVLWGGGGRGSATLFTALARTSLPYTGLTKLLILEAPYWDLHEVLRHWRAGWWWRCCTAWGERSKSPGSYADRFPMTIPILVVGSRGDGVVPSSTARAFAEELATLRFDVHYLELRNAEHGQYGMLDPSRLDVGEQDAVLYRRVLHAAYKELGLPYIGEMARMGHEAWMRAKLGSPSS